MVPQAGTGMSECLVEEALLHEIEFTLGIGLLLGGGAEDGFEFGVFFFDAPSGGIDIGFVAEDAVELNGGTGEKIENEEWTEPGRERLVKNTDREETGGHDCDGAPDYDAPLMNPNGLVAARDGLKLGLEARLRT